MGEAAIAITAGFVLIFATIVGTAVTLLTLPGLWLIVAVGLVFWIFNHGMFNPWTMVVVVALGIVAEVVEFAAGSVGSTMAGGGKRAGLGAAIGGLIGAIAGTILLPVPVLGTIIGAAAGAGLGAAAMEPTGMGKTKRDRLKIGTGAAIGRVTSVVIKAAISLVMGVILVVAAFVR